MTHDTLEQITKSLKYELGINIEYRRIGEFTSSVVIRVGKITTLSLIHITGDDHATDWYGTEQEEVVPCEEIEKYIIDKYLEGLKKHETDVRGYLY